MCDGVCGDAVKKEVAKGNIGSVSCIGLQHPVWEPSSGPREVAAANCSCNNALLNVFAENFMDALPAIGEVSTYACDALEPNRYPRQRYGPR